MKQKPILFSTAMVQAILNGSKTQTRRMVKMYKSDEHPLRQNSEWFIENKTCPYGKVGELLWVRETFGFDDAICHYFYKANYDESDINHLKGSWKPSIHMPKVACRIWLQITNIRVERLQKITEQDAQNEGATHDRAIGYGQIGGSHREGFINLWQSINGEQSWQQNPWVWVIEFKRIDKTNNFLNN